MNKNMLSIMIVVLLFGLSLGTSSLPPPFYKYSISGKIKCDTISNLSGYSIMLFTKHIDPDSAFTIFTGDYENSNQQPIGKTDIYGSFYILIHSNVFFDTFKLGYIDKDNIVRFSEIYNIDENELNEVIERYSEANTNSGCSSCTEEVAAPSKTRIVSYYYKLDNVSFEICK